MLTKEKRVENGIQICLCVHVNGNNWLSLPHRVCASENSHVLKRNFGENPRNLFMNLVIDCFSTAK